MATYTITDRDARYTATPTTGLLAGVTLTDGRLSNHATHGRIVDFPFAANAEALADLVERGVVKPGQTMTLRLATNPDLAAAVALAEAEVAKAIAEHKPFWMQEQWISDRGMDLTQEMDREDSAL